MVLAIILNKFLFSKVYFYFLKMFVRKNKKIRDYKANIFNIKYDVVFGVAL